MDKGTGKNEIEILGNKAIHFVLSHSYIVFLLSIILGIIFHNYYNIHILNGVTVPYIGLIVIILGTLLIYWAQSSSKSQDNKEIEEERNEKDFERGPYAYSRNPTHIGLTMVTLGLGLILNSFFIFVFVIIASLVTKLIFIRKEEKLLERKYGQKYLDYKKKVSTWI